MTALMIVSVVLLIGTVILAPSATAQQPKMMIYPSKGQSPQQEQADKGACMEWATQQSGFNPTDALEPSSAPPPAQAPQASGGKGMVRGAALGTAVGAIAGNTGEGAAIGAAAGLLFGHMRQRDEMQKQQQQQQAWASQQANSYTQKQDAFNRAYTACLQGRGYTVN
jgi:hypothetical protein